MKNVLIIGFLLSVVISGCYYDEPVPSDQNVWTVAQPSDFGLQEDVLLEMDSLINAQANEGIMSIVILKGDHLVYEKYYHGHTRRSVFELDGVSSAFANVALGRAIAMGLVQSVDDSIYKYLPEYEQEFEDFPLKKNITFEHLMAMKSGLSWNEFSSGFDGRENDLDRIVKSENWAEYIISKPIDALPGARYAYNSAIAIIISEVIENQYQGSYQNFLTQEVFPDMGIEHMEMALAGSKVNAAWGISASTLDLAKIGYLYLNKGNWFGSQLVSDAYVVASTDAQTRIDYSNDFGWMWWRYSEYNNFLNFLDQNDIYFVAGDADQRLYIIPHLEMVVAITGNNRSSDINLSAPFVLRDYILGALQ